MREHPNDIMAELADPGTGILSDETLLRMIDAEDPRLQTGPLTLQQLASSSPWPRILTTAPELRAWVVRISAVKGAAMKRGRGRPRKAAASPPPLERGQFMPRAVQLAALAMAEGPRAGREALREAQEAARLPLARYRMLVANMAKARVNRAAIGPAFLALLKRHGAPPTAAAIAKRIGVSVKTVERCTAEMRKLGWKLGC